MVLNSGPQHTKTRPKINFKFPYLKGEVHWHPESNIPWCYWVVFTYLGRALSLCPCTGFTPETNFPPHWARAHLLGHGNAKQTTACETRASPMMAHRGPKTLMLWSIIRHKTSQLFTPYKPYTLTMKNRFTFNPPAWSTDAGRCIVCLCLRPRDVGPRGANAAWVRVTCQSNKRLPRFVGPWPVCWDARQGAKLKAVSNDLPLCCWKLK